jgi:hypothetical protein
MPYSAFHVTSTSHATELHQVHDFHILYLPISAILNRVTKETPIWLVQDSDILLTCDHKASQMQHHKQPHSSRSRTQHYYGQQRRR